jgi:hypothetical protein
LSGEGQVGNIETFNFSLGDEVLYLAATELTNYINDVLALNKPSLLTYVTSSTLDLSGATVNISALTAHGDLFDKIKQGGSEYVWDDESAWVLS